MTTDVPLFIHTPRDFLAVADGILAICAPLGIECGLTYVIELHSEYVLCIWAKDGFAEVQLQVGPGGHSNSNLIACGMFIEDNDHGMSARDFKYWNDLTSPNLFDEVGEYAKTLINKF